MKYFPS